MEDILKSLVTLGGFGFFNYKVLFSITDFDSGSSADKHYFIAFMSSLVDFTVFPTEKISDKKIDILNN